MSANFTAACVQFTAARDYEPNIRAVADLVRRARDGGADLVLTPENTGLMEPIGKLRREKARDEANHPVLAALREVARETGAWLLLGSLAVDISREPGVSEGERRLANRSYLIDAGRRRRRPLRQDPHVRRRPRRRRKLPREQCLPAGRPGGAGPRPRGACSA